MKDSKAFNFDGEYGDDYKELASRVIPGYGEFFVATHALLRERIGSKARILIVGCGTGREIEVFAPSENEWKFDCVDPSRSMVDYSRQVAEGIGVSSRVRFHHAYTHELEFGYQFDAATIINVMHFLEDNGSKDMLMKSVAQKVSCGGTVTLFDLHGDPSAPYFELFYATWDRFMDLRGYSGKKKEQLFKRLETGIAYVSEDRILQICHDAGLRLIRSYWSGLLYTGWVFEKSEYT